MGYVIGIYGDLDWFLDQRQHTDIGYKLGGFMPETIRWHRTGLWIWGWICSPVTVLQIIGLFDCLIFRISLWQFWYRWYLTVTKCIWQTWICFLTEAKLSNFSCKKTGFSRNIEIWVVIYLFFFHTNQSYRKKKNGRSIFWHLQTILFRINEGSNHWKTLASFPSSIIV